MGEMVKGKQKDRRQAQVGVSYAQGRFRQVRSAVNPFQSLRLDSLDDNTATSNSTLHQ
jgi:hypothetical protein